MLRDVIRELLVQLPLQRGRQKPFPIHQNLEPLPPELRRLAADPAQLRDILGGLDAAPPQHAGRRQQTGREYIRLLFQRVVVWMGLPVYQPPLPYVPQQDVAQFVGRCEPLARDGLVPADQDPGLAVDHGALAVASAAPVIIPHVNAHGTAKRADIDRQSPHVPVHEYFPRHIPRRYVLPVIQAKHLHNHCKGARAVCLHVRYGIFSSDCRESHPCTPARPRRLYTGFGPQMRGFSAQQVSRLLIQL